MYNYYMYNTACLLVGHNTIIILSIVLSVVSVVCFLWTTLLLLLLLLLLVVTCVVWLLLWSLVRIIVVVIILLFTVRVPYLLMSCVGCVGKINSIICTTVCSWAHRVAYMIHNIVAILLFMAMSSSNKETCAKPRKKFANPQNHYQQSDRKVAHDRLN